ncbi:MAG: acyltransferase [Nitrospinota bacterium]|nr:acyltransferase [Nitrospinota bacterium]
MTENFIHDSAEIHSDSRLGSNCYIWHFVHIREDVIVGSDCVFGRGVYIGPGVEVGNAVKIQNYALIYQPAVIEDFVFVGPGAIITNDRFPRSTNEHGSLKDEDDWNIEGVRLQKGSSIGAQAIILAGVDVGAWAMVGAGALVSKPVPDFALVAGSPARQIGWVGKSGKKLIREKDFWICPNSKEVYFEKDGQLFLSSGKMSES